MTKRESWGGLGIKWKNPAPDATSIVAPTGKCAVLSVLPMPAYQYQKPFIGTAQSTETI